MDFYLKKSSGVTIAQGLSLEWIETNGLGGYSSSTVINCHTRKYHGLLVSKIESFPDKFVFLSKLDDCILYEGKQYFLTAHNYPNFLQDGSFANFEEFALDTHPNFKFKINDLLVSKEYLMLTGEDTVFIKYKFTNLKSEVKLQIRPLIAYRNFHNLTKNNDKLKTATFVCRNGIAHAPYEGMPTLYLQSDSQFTFVAEPLWYYNFLYELEKARGYDYLEDLFNPGLFTFSLPPDTSKEIIFSCSLDQQITSLNQRFVQELFRRDKNNLSLVGSPLQKQLIKVGESFIQSDKNKNPESVVAGYHWFLEWGRDAMISLPGLTLYSGKEEECLAILKNFAKFEKQGLIPNYLGSSIENSAYNSVDASLWFAWAVQQYYAKTQDAKGIALYLWPTLKNIFNNFKNGTLYNIKMQDNGLLYAGRRDLNLTWMDAIVDGLPVIPRYGLIVEVNALWYNLLAFMAELSNVMLDSVKHEIIPIMENFEKNFLGVFWDEELGYLYDYVNAEEKNKSLRPNQIFALSLTHSIVPKKIASKILKIIYSHLFTSYGLRTLSPVDKSYIGTYQGNQKQRDLAYHNGCIWPWMIAHFAEALMKIGGKRQRVIKILSPVFKALTDHLAEVGIGTISEIFSGDEHKPDGCISQAWNIAELSRLTFLLQFDKNG